MEKIKNNFAEGNVYKHIISIAIPMIVAQLVQLVYNVTDRIYLGHIEGGSSLALTGVGVVFPIVALVMAFTNLLGNGGAPLCSIERGKNNIKKAEQIMSNSFVSLIFIAFLIMLLTIIFIKPLLYFFGAGKDSFKYAFDYLKIYILGTPFVMLSTGMNGFINSQGFGKTAMVTVVSGAVINILLDPVFIFVFNMGVEGAALATVISQIISCVWVLLFLFGKKTILKIKIKHFKPDFGIIKEITALGLAGFIMSASNGVVQIACNNTLKAFGGDVYVGIMTVLNSVREIVILPVHGLSGGMQPVIGFNLGAKKYDRVKKSIKFTSIIGVVYTVLAWVFLIIFPEFLIKIFTNDYNLIVKGVPALRIFFFGFFMMSLQFAGQSTFVGLGMSKQAIFFSLLRKIVIVVPLTLILPYVMNLGVNGVFVAEPVSNFIGGTACFLTMLNYCCKKLGNVDTKE